MDPTTRNSGLTELTIPAVRTFEEQATGREPVTRHGARGDGQAGLDVGRRTGVRAGGVVRDMRGRRGDERRQERRQKSKLKVGVDIPTPVEIKAIVGAPTGHWRPIILTAVHL